MRATSSFVCDVNTIRSNVVGCFFKCSEVMSTDVSKVVNFQYIYGTSYDNRLVL